MSCPKRGRRQGGVNSDLDKYRNNFRQAVRKIRIRAFELPDVDMPCRPWHFAWPFYESRSRPGKGGGKNERKGEGKFCSVQTQVLAQVLVVNSVQYNSGIAYWR